MAEGLASQRPNALRRNMLKAWHRANEALQIDANMEVRHAIAQALAEGLCDWP